MSGRPLMPHGTTAAYRRHQYNGTPPCAACRAGHAADERARRDRERQAADIRKIVHILACAMGVGRDLA